MKKKLNISKHFGFMNQKTNGLIVSIVLLFFASSLIGQETDIKSKLDEIKAQRKAFISEKLILTSEESSGFWPIYQKYTDEMDALKLEKAKIRRTLVKKIDELNEAELDKLINDDLMNDQKIVESRKRYHTEFRRVLSAKKVIRLHLAERQFKETLAKRMRERGLKSNDLGD